MVAPFPNPHFLEIFDSEPFRRFAQVDRFCFRPLPSHRQGLGWKEGAYKPLSSSYLSVGTAHKKLKPYQTVIFYGSIDPKFIPTFLLRGSLKRGQNTYLVTEGIRHKISKWKALCFQAYLNDSRLNILAIGYNSSNDFRDAGLVKPTYRRYGFFENYIGGPDLKSNSSKNPSQALQLLSVGQLIDRKNFSACINSLKRLASKIKQPVNYTICGDGEQRAELEQAAAQLDVDITVHLPGNCNAEQLDAYFRAADLFLMPSKYDGWGVVLNQAVHFHLPLIAAEGVRSARGHLLREGGNGFIFRDNDELDRVLLKLIVDQSLRDKFSTCCRQVAADWHIDAVAENLVKVLNGQDPTLHHSESPLALI